MTCELKSRWGYFCLQIMYENQNVVFHKFVGTKKAYTFDPIKKKLYHRFLIAKSALNLLGRSYEKS